MRLDQKNGHNRNTCMERYSLRQLTQEANKNTGILKNNTGWFLLGSFVPA